MLFGNRKINDDINIEIDNAEIKRVNENKFLIKYLCSKMAKSIGVLSKSRYILNQKTLHTLYSTLILPYLSYCVKIWANTYKSALHKICTLQNRAIQILNHAGILITPILCFLITDSEIYGPSET